MVEWSAVSIALFLFGGFGDGLDKGSIGACGGSVMNQWG